MEVEKCSLEEHEKIDAISYCQECKIKMCNKCSIIHSGLLKKHHQYKLDKNSKDIFTGFCKEENHLEILEFFCKDHNKLCCSSCIVKIIKEGKGQHTNCNVCIIEDIKQEKINKLDDNIKCLKDLSNSLQIKNIKSFFEKIKERKEKIKKDIQSIFTKIRSVLNEREDKLLLKVDEIYNNNFLKERYLGEYENLPNKINHLLENTEMIKNYLNDNNKLNLVINECINIENIIEDIKIINEKMNKISDVSFIAKDNELLNIVDNFGTINIEEKMNKIILSNSQYYTISGQDSNIITKIKSDAYIGTLVGDKLEENKVYKWNIKILNSKDHNHFYIGVAPSNNFTINSYPEKCGWYIYCYTSCFYSGPPFNFNGKQTKLNDDLYNAKELIVIMHMKNRTLTFKKNDKDVGDSYTNIPKDKPLCFAIFMYYINDSIQIHTTITNI